MGDRSVPTDRRSARQDLRTARDPGPAAAARDTDPTHGETKGIVMSSSHADLHSYGKQILQSGPSVQRVLGAHLGAAC